MSEGKTAQAIAREDLALKLFEIDQLPTDLIADRIGIGRKGVQRLLREARARRDRLQDQVEHSSHRR